MILDFCVNPSPIPLFTELYTKKGDEASIKLANLIFSEAQPLLIDHAKKTDDDYRLEYLTFYNRILQERSHELSALDQRITKVMQTVILGSMKILIQKEARLVVEPFEFTKKLLNPGEISDHLSRVTTEVRNKMGSIFDVSLKNTQSEGCDLAAIAEKSLKLSQVSSRYSEHLYGEYFKIKSYPIAKMMMAELDEQSLAIVDQAAEISDEEKMLLTYFKIF